MDSHSDSAQNPMDLPPPEVSVPPGQWAGGGHLSLGALVTNWDRNVVEKPWKTMVHNEQMSEEWLVTHW